MEEYFTLENFQGICNNITNIEHVLQKLNQIYVVMENGIRRILASFVNIMQIVDIVIRISYFLHRFVTYLAGWKN